MRPLRFECLHCSSTKAGDMHHRCRYIMSVAQWHSVVWHMLRSCCQRTKNSAAAKTPVSQSHAWLSMAQQQLRTPACRTYFCCCCAVGLGVHHAGKAGQVHLAVAARLAHSCAPALSASGACACKLLGGVHVVCQPRANHDFFPGRALPSRMTVLMRNTKTI
jgi:hypothetical protein